MVSLDIRLKRANKTYVEDETVSGLLVLESQSELKHDGLVIVVDGVVKMDLSPKSVGLLEALVSSVKPIPLTQCSIEVLKAGKLPSGTNQFPFEFPLKSLKANRPLFETYHGVFINIQYVIRAELKRSKLYSKTVTKTQEIMLEYKPDDAERANNRPININISPESLQNVLDRSRVPSFAIHGRIDSTQCKMTQPLSGVLCVEHCDTKIRSIELQLVRVETCGCAEGYSRDATEIQNIQIGEGDVSRGVNIPIHMVFPRLFTCPTLVTSNFKIEFEVNVVIVFDDNHLITENYPIKLTRA
ncbi:Down syndrome critical region protein 3 homolog [Galendromus occidentalis]|uniref:Down syndrome critical region protein 3 homolog n=1 Tax=Galendromus occidentalis TaxID=34638 RepID=A0AAJ6VWM1_9ACAR|nr:Down syndrome critical region protein 3 homolog [Galendromus occidentalis]